MLEYFTYKKVKKHKAAKKAKEEEEARAKEVEDTKAAAEPPKNDARLDRTETHGSADSEAPPLPERPILDRSDESFIQSLLSEDGPVSPVSDEITVPQLDWPSDDAASLRSKDDALGAKDKEKEDVKGKGKEKEDKDGAKGNRLSRLFSKRKKHSDGLKPSDANIPEDEQKREESDINNVLDRLNLSARNNKVISLSDESAELLQKFTQVFKDLANGVPTAYDDLLRLINDRDGTINRGFDKLPSSLKKLVTQLPDKLTSSIAPEILAAAAKSQGINASAEGGIKETAQKMFLPQNLLELITKPGALVGMLRAIVSALQTRWPAFIGVNVIWSVALFLLMFVLWYCHKRGREIRLEKEKSDAEGNIDGSSRIEELPDDPLLSEPRPDTTRLATTGEASNPVEAAPPTASR